MKTNIKIRWLEALRSGKYLQATENLRKNGGYCCLGVLCDILDPDGWDGDLYSGRSKHLPMAYRKSCELQETQLNTLMEMNDGGCSFEEIADYIEESL